jgi:hypothetical protein
MLADYVRTAERERLYGVIRRHLEQYWVRITLCAGTAKEAGLLRRLRLLLNIHAPFKFPHLGIGAQEI